jgi:hypothetical protein
MKVDGCNLLTPEQGHCAMAGQKSMLNQYCFDINCIFDNKTVWVQLTAIIIVALAIFQLASNCCVVGKFHKTRLNHADEPLPFSAKFSLGVTTTFHAITVLVCSILTFLTFFWSNFPEAVASAWKDNVNLCMQGG